MKTRSTFPPPDHHNTDRTEKGRSCEMVEEIRRWLNRTFEVPPSPVGSLAISHANYLLTMLDEAREQTDRYERGWWKMAQAMQCWGWSHCTAEKEVIEQIDDTLTQLEAAKQREAGFHKHIEKLYTEINDAEVRLERYRQAFGDLTLGDAIDQALAKPRHVEGG